MAPWGSPSISLSSPLTQIISSKHIVSLQRDQSQCHFSQCADCHRRFFFFCLSVQLDENEERVKRWWQNLHVPNIPLFIMQNTGLKKFNQALVNAEKPQLSEREIWKMTNIYNWLSTLFVIFFTVSDILPKFHMPNLPFQKNNEILISFDASFTSAPFLSSKSNTVLAKPSLISTIPHSYTVLEIWNFGKLTQGKTVARFWLAGLAMCVYFYLGFFFFFNFPFLCS